MIGLQVFCAVCTFDPILLFGMLRVFGLLDVAGIQPLQERFIIHGLCVVKSGMEAAAAVVATTDSPE